MGLDEDTVRYLRWAVEQAELLLRAYPTRKGLAFHAASQMLRLDSADRLIAELEALTNAHQELIAEKDALLKLHAVAITPAKEEVVQLNVKLNEYREAWSRIEPMASLGQKFQRKGRGHGPMFKLIPESVSPRVKGLHPAGAFDSR